MITKDIRKTLTVKPNGRSSDFISPSFGWGCLFNCTYCTCKRYKPEGVSIATNTNAILEAINTTINQQQWPKVPNQTHDEYYTVDIS